MGAEYAPLMREEFRRIGGDTAVEALARRARRNELVEHGLLTADDFRGIMFTDAMRFWNEVNPDFFKGTVVEKPAAEVPAQGT
jgi:hypothetical protein